MELKKSARAREADALANNRDAFLCYCDQVTSDDFRQAVWANAAMSFTELCSKFNVGLKCTACLLNAEELFVDALQTRPATFKQTKDSSRQNRLTRKQAVYSFIDRWSPRASLHREQPLPIIRGMGVKTELAISNAFSEAIGPRATTYDFRLRVYDASGQQVDEDRFTLEQGERFDDMISERLPANEGADGLTTGSCWVDWTARTEAYRGSIRPHYLIYGRKSVTALHTQAGSKDGKSSFLTVKSGDDETQYLSLVNCGDKEAEISMKIYELHGGGEPETITRRLPVLSADLVELPLPATTGEKPRPIMVELQASQFMRRHLTICYGEADRISVDHV